MFLHMKNALLITQIIKTIVYFSAMITHSLYKSTDILTLMKLYFLEMNGKRCTYHMIFCLPVNKPSDARVICSIPH